MGCKEPQLPFFSEIVKSALSWGANPVSGDGAGTGRRARDQLDVRAGDLGQARDSVRGTPLAVVLGDHDAGGAGDLVEADAEAGTRSRAGQRGDVALGDVQAGGAWNVLRFTPDAALLGDDEWLVVLGLGGVLVIAADDAVAGRSA